MDRIVMMDGGRRAVGTPMELCNARVARFVAVFIGSRRINFLDVQVNAADAKATDVTPGACLLLARTSAASRSATRRCGPGGTALDRCSLREIRKRRIEGMRSSH